jgi:DMSO/TMAO reductase YedYZ heme-binding membrane subunit
VPVSALVFLGVTLAVTPFRRIFATAIIDVRQMLGVGTFCYRRPSCVVFRRPKL